MPHQNFDEAVKEYEMAMREFFKGNPKPLNIIYSSCDEISLAQLSGSFIKGRNQVTEVARQNALKYREGNTTFETLTKYVTPDVAYIVQVERADAKIDGKNESSTLALRVTSIFRREDGVWKLLHRHVDSYPFPKFRGKEKI
jgi:ketosteroid isomerase-like protein